MIRAIPSTWHKTLLVPFLRFFHAQLLVPLLTPTSTPGLSLSPDPALDLDPDPDPTPDPVLAPASGPSQVHSHSPFTILCRRISGRDIASTILRGRIEAGARIGSRIKTRIRIRIRTRIKIRIKSRTKRRSSSWGQVWKKRRR